MIVFNDPIPCADHTERAVRLAIEMRDKVEELSQHWGRQGYNLGFGIGIAAGYATLGQIGFEHRRESTRHDRRRTKSCTCACATKHDRGKS